MAIRTVLLASALVAILIFFGLGMFGIGFGAELRPPAIDLQKAIGIVLAQCSNARLSAIELDMEGRRLVYAVELGTKEMACQRHDRPIGKREHD